MYKNNDFISNGWAINSRGANYLNEFRKNNFIGNSFDLSYNGPLNRNVFEGNYWSDYVGYDLDKDGVGDVPYRPVKLFNHVVNRSPEAIILLRSIDRKSTRLNSSHVAISYAVFCLKKKRATPG